VKPSVTTFNCLITAASDSGSYEALAEIGACLQRAVGLGLEVAINVSEGCLAAAHARG
jgi:hypothetical protein